MILSPRGLLVVCLCCLLVLPVDVWARGGGGRGGGGGGRGGGFSGGGARPGGGMSRPSGGISRPSGGSAPTFNRPSAPRPSAPNINRPTGGARPNVPNVANRPNVNRPNVSRPNLPGNVGPNRPNLPGGVAGGGRPNLPGAGAGRPNLPGAAGGARPNLPGNIGQNRPNIPGAGARPNLPGVGNRPGIGDRPQISQLPGSLRPDLGNRPGVNRPGLDNRPGIGNGPGIANRPGIDNRPGFLPGQTQRPGIGNRPGIDNRPGINRPGGDNNFVNRPGNNNIGNNIGNNVIGSGNDFNFNNYNFNNNVANNWAQNNHWDNWHNHPWYGDWHHGHWNGNWNNNWYGGGQSWWNHMWDDHTAAMVGLTAWGVGSALYNFGYWNYTNPYYTQPYVIGATTIDYSQPLIVEVPVPTTVVTTDPNAAIDPNAVAAATPPAQPPEPGLEAFDLARTAFQSGNYEAALQQTDRALEQMPKDATVHEFRALVMFALGRYRDAAATLYAVLSVGPGWDWTTMIGLYSSASTYEEQLRKLEAAVKANPKAPETLFVLGYHYLTAGHNEAAAAQFRKVTEINPQDQLAAQLCKMTGGEPAGQPTTPPLPDAPAPAAEAVPPSPEALIGDWKAEVAMGPKFGLSLTKDNKFTWTVQQGDKSTMKAGEYSLEKEMLLLKPSDGGQMLARVSAEDKGFNFQPFGAPPTDPGLNFHK